MNQSETCLEHLAVIKTFAEGELLSWLPFMNIAGGSLFYPVEKDLPSVGFRAVNEGYKQSYGVVAPQSEAVHLFGGDVDVDRSMLLTLEAVQINGDATASQGRGFDGLAKRLMPGSEMALNNGGGALDFDKLDELIDSVNSHGGRKDLVMSKAMRRQLNALARQTVGQGGYNVSTNNSGVMVHHYQECQILTVDRDAQGLQGPFQGRYGISVRDLGEVPDAPVFRTRIDWSVGFGVMHPRAAGRLPSIALIT